MFTYKDWARVFVFAALFLFFKGNNDGAVLFTNVAIVLAILETAKKEKE